MLFKRLLEIFSANAQSKTKKSELSCKECNFIYVNTYDECPDCKYMKILTDKSFDEMSDGLRVIRTRSAVSSNSRVGYFILDYKSII